VSTSAALKRYAHISSHHPDPVGVFTAHPASFVIVAVYVVAWLIIDPGSSTCLAVPTIFERLVFNRG
jgi:hypothetical protein